MTPEERILYVATAPDGYYEALGKFISAFSRVEEALFFLLVEMLHIPINEAQAIFVGLRVKVATETLTRLRESRHLPPSGFWQNTIEHLGTINGVRDDLVHYGIALHVSQQGMQYVTTDLMRKHTAGKKVASFAVISVEILRAMTEDLNTLVYRLMLFHVDPSPDDHLDQIEFFDARAPWRYKHTSPSSRSGKPPHNSQ